MLCNRSKTSFPLSNKTDMGQRHSPPPRTHVRPHLCHIIGIW
jgi:hypothetical protein